MKRTTKLASPTRQGLTTFKGALYFHVNLGGASVREFVLDFGEDHTNGITTTNFTNFTNNADWYTLDGRKLDSKPTKKGIYIYKGKKVIM